MTDFSQDTMASISSPRNDGVSPIESSLEPFSIDPDNESALIHSNTWSQQPQQPQYTRIQDQSPKSTSESPQVHIPLLKRRRVTRACDECRRKKIKCDGKQPCTHCTVYNYDCTYDQPSNRRRNPTPQYIEALENRVRRAEALLNSVFPGLDINDPKINTLIHQKNLAHYSIDQPQSQSLIDITSESKTENKGMILCSPVDGTGRLNQDGSGNWDFHGESSGIGFLHQIQERVYGFLSDDKTPLFPNSTPDMLSSCAALTFSPQPPYKPPGLPDLPLRETAEALCKAAFSKTYFLYCFVHLPTFYETLDKIYEPPRDTSDDSNSQFFALLFAILALGYITQKYCHDSYSRQETQEIGMDVNEGHKYFTCARSAMDITDCRNIPQLQAILFMILYLQSTADLKVCYSYIGMAQRSAIRMGLNRNLTNECNKIECEVRRRIFWVIQKMDISISAVLGYPKVLDYDDIDQDMPIEVDDEYITKNAVLPVPGGKPSLLLQASNAHTRLSLILAKVIRYIYPTKNVEKSVYEVPSTGYAIDHAQIHDIEDDLTHWLEKLPTSLRPGGDEGIESISTQQFLRLSYAHVQMMLYRPFLLCFSKKDSATETRNKKSLACAAACVKVSRNIIRIVRDLTKHRIMVGPCWFMINTTYFAILSLVYFVLENTDASSSPDILYDILLGQEALGVLAQSSQAARRCLDTLKALSEKLSTKLHSISSYPVTPANKKRHVSYSTALTDGSVQSRMMSPSHSCFSLESCPSSAMTNQTSPFFVPSTTQAYTQLQPPRFGEENLTTFSVSGFKFPDISHEINSPTNSCGMRAHNLGRSRPSMALQRRFTSQLSNGHSFPEFKPVIFPSTDPFRFESQQISLFDNGKCNSDQATNNKQQDLFHCSTSVNEECAYGELDGQIMGPLPPYLVPVQSTPIVPTDISVTNVTNGSLIQNFSYNNEISSAGGIPELDLFSEESRGTWNED
ncbi:BgTH12-03435 [Blumeria graminis f. sp. triticale]|uniref:BgTH12-03435 n=1 Tax=Blumeria graminis f. sp. triticale TaxID=1689686 RepID=A0A9W4CV83_BLUGR|nr:BgTH12-03435 [Blumeria graminis f. sp. triticale]